MILEELYDYYKKWAVVSRELKFGVSTIKNWRHLGYIPIASQMRIEAFTNGLFKASIKDAIPLNRGKK